MLGDSSLPVYHGSRFFCLGTRLMKCGVIAGERRLHVAPVLEEVAGRTLVGFVYRRECKLKPCQQCA